MRRNPALTRPKLPYIREVKIPQSETVIASPHYWLGDFCVCAWPLFNQPDLILKVEIILRPKSQEFRANKMEGCVRETVWVAPGIRWYLIVIVVICCKG